MENGQVKYNIEIDDYPLSFSPFQSIDFNFKMIAKLLYFNLKNNKNCTMERLSPYIVEIKLFDTFVKNKIISKNFVDSLQKHVSEKSFYSRYLSFIDIKKIEIISDYIFRVKLKIPINYINDILESYFFVPINDKGIPIKRRELQKTMSGFKIFDSNKSFNFIVNKDPDITCKLFDSNKLDISAFSMPNYNLVEYDFYQRENFKYISSEGSLIYYIKFNGEHSFLEYFSLIRLHLQKLLSGDRFLIPVISFIGTTFTNDLPIDCLGKTLVNKSFDQNIKIGYSDYPPNKKIAKALQKILLDMFNVSSILVEFKNLSTLISNFSDVDIALGITYPSFNNYISVGLDILPDLEQDSKRIFIEALNLDKYDSLEEILTYSKSMLPVFKSNHCYVKRKGVSFQINTYGELFDDELK